MLEYKIVSTDVVNAFLQQGWELYGHPHVSANGYHCQAMVRERRDGDGPVADATTERRPPYGGTF